MAKQLTPRQIQLIARIAIVDPRTVRKALAGESHSTTTARVLAAMEKLGLQRPAPEARA